jgi:SAM-dependent methyltransferase
MTLGREYFESVYGESADPFRLDDNWYEERKYALTLASLPKQTYRRALEPGCSIGILTDKLAARCQSLVSTDIAPAALAAARARVESPHVSFLEWSLTDEWTAVSAGGDFDLIVLSEVGYHLDEADLRAASTGIVEHLEDGGTLIAVHWRHPVADYPQTGDRVHAVIGETDGLVRIAGYSDDDVILEVFVASTGAVDSVAGIEGLV